jgi:hypothetical protein
LPGRDLHVSEFLLLGIEDPSMHGWRSAIQPSPDARNSELKVLSGLTVLRSYSLTGGHTHRNSYLLAVHSRRIRLTVQYVNWTLVTDTAINRRPCQHFITIRRPRQGRAGHLCKLTANSVALYVRTLAYIFIKLEAK